VDDLDAELRAANPSELRRTTPLTLRAEADLAALLASPASQLAPARVARRRLGGRAPTVAAIAVTIALSAVFVVSDLGPPTPASVAAPPLLEATGAQGDPKPALEELAAIAAARGDAPSSMDQVIRYEAWSAQLEVGATATSAFVQPEVVERRCNSDGSGYWEARAGDVRYGSAPDNAPAERPGELLRRDEFAAGEFPMAFDEAPPTGARDLDAYLRAEWGLGETAESFDYFLAIEGLRLEWRLSGAQTAAVLELLAARSDLTLAGRVTDRLGRDGVAFETVRSDGALRSILVFSPETGMLLSTESVYLGGIPDLELDYPTVTNYYAWKDTR
jgi:hypothetical protein